MVQSLDDDDNEDRGWRCDGCGKRQALNKEASLVLHGQTSSGGMSISFCGGCSIEREKWQKLLEETQVTVYGRLV